MNEKDIIDMIKNDDALKADDKLWNSIEGKIKSEIGSSSITSRKKRIPIYRYAIASSCVIVILLMVMILPNLNKQSINDSNKSLPATNGGNQTINAPIKQAPITNGGSMHINGPVVNGPIMFTYYRYDGKYYKAEYPTTGSNDQIAKDFADIQNKIDKNLGNDFYRISGIDPSKSIAHYNGRYYYKLDYAFDDSISYNGKSYLIAANETPDPNVDPKTGKPEFIVGKYLGKSGSYDIYELPGSAPSEKVAVKLDPNTSNYCIAYQLPSTVTLNGTTYEVQLGINTASGAAELKYLGKAGPYDAYESSDDPADQIILHINDHQEVLAKAVAKPSDDSIPKSMYGSPFEAMYPSLSNIQWDRIIYQIGSYDYVNNQDVFIKQIGKKLGSFTFNNITYFIYEINGTDPSRSVAVKNNEVYMKYDFQLNGAVKFDGKDYEISITGDSGIRGPEIGMSGSNAVYSIKGVDPSKEIIVLIDGTTWTAYRK